MNSESAIYLSIAGVVMLGVAFLLGRRTSGAVARQLELEAELTGAQREQARAEAEAERLSNELEIARREADDYRLRVVDHFSGTSDLLRDLTVQYRSVYEHLTKGASALCPEGFVGLTEGLPMPQLAEPQADLAFDPDCDELVSPDVAAPADEYAAEAAGMPAPEDETEETVDADARPLPI